MQVGDAIAGNGAGRRQFEDALQGRDRPLPEREPGRSQEK
jgi:hypothetical protein